MHNRFGAVMHTFNPRLRQVDLVSSRPARATQTLSQNSKKMCIMDCWDGPADKGACHPAGGLSLLARIPMMKGEK